MLFPRDSLSALDLGAFGTIKDEERKEWHTHKLHITEEQCAKFGVLSLSSIRSVKGPDGHVNADAKTTKISRIGLKTIDDGDVSKQLQLPRRSENLSRVRGSTWTSGCTHIPKASHTHLCNNKTIPSPKFPAIHLQRVRSHDRTWGDGPLLFIPSLCRCNLCHWPSYRHSPCRLGKDQARGHTVHAALGHGAEHA